MRNSKINSVNNQNGAVLIVALIMLLVMTIAGITTMSGATLQERMAGNARQKAIAKINAEAALRSAENYLGNLNLLTATDVTNALNNVMTDATNTNVAIDDNLRGTGGYKLLPIDSDDAIRPIDVNNFDVNDGESWQRQGNRNTVSFAPGDIAIPAATRGANSPRYIIEYIGRYLEGDARGDDAVEVGTGRRKPESTAFAFRITSIGWGQDANVYSILQSVFITQQG